MPKTSKKTKASKGTGLKKRFDLKNRKVQFFVTIAIVALLGGGWFTYKSFAASNIFNVPITTANIPNSDAHASSGKCGNKIVVETVNKSSNPVLQLWCPSNLVINSQVYNTTYLRPGTKGSVNGRSYRACVVAKGQGNIIIRVAGVNAGVEERGANITVNKNYSTYCSIYAKATVSPYPTKILAAVTETVAKPNTLINISKAYVEEYLPAVSPVDGSSETPVK